MIIKKQLFSYRNRPIIEKAIVKAPQRFDAVFEEQGCFLYFKDTGYKLFSAEDNTLIHNDESLLLRCGTYFLDLVERENDKQTEVVSIHLFPDLLREFYQDDLVNYIAKHTTKRASILPSQDLISAFIQSLDFYFDHPLLVNDELIELKVKELILLLIQTHHIDSIRSLIDGLQTKKDVQLQQVIELHLYTNLSLDEIAKLCYMSLSSFKRSFREIFEDSPRHYILTKRLDKAKQMLKNPTLSISDIAYEIGFNDPQYFTRLFKKYVEISPTNYRLDKKSSNVNE